MTAVEAITSKPGTTESSPQLPADAQVSLAVDVDDRVAAATLSPSTGQLLLTWRRDEPGLALTAWETIG